MRIAVDIDEVLAKLHDAWLDAYNWHTGHDLTEFTCWDISTLVLPGWKEKVFDLLTPDLYQSVLPYEDAEYFLERLRGYDHKIVFATSCRRDDRLAAAKFRWLVSCGLFKDGDTYAPGSDKTVHHCSVLVDDYPGNCLAFSRACFGNALLMDRPYNQTEFRCARVGNLAEAFWAITGNKL